MTLGAWLKKLSWLFNHGMASFYDYECRFLANFRSRSTANAKCSHRRLRIVEIHKLSDPQVEEMPHGRDAFPILHMYEIPSLPRASKI
ncbi:hypothetical protein FF1_000375 [Malus domestica]